MEIAPGIDASEWGELNLGNQDSADWEKAISILEQRIKARYLDPVDLLLEQDNERPPRRRRFGFTILAIDCLLVETLQAFMEGKKDTLRQSRIMFQNFLTERASFKSHFDKAIANRFYDNFRCGILHQAEIRGGSRVWSVGSLLKMENGALIVNRSEFHARLKKEFEQYLSDLRNSGNKHLRDRFRTKMTHICVCLSQSAT